MSTRNPYETMAGRRPIDPEKRRRKTNLTLDPHVVDNAQEIASKAGVSLSELVNRLLDNLETTSQEKSKMDGKIEESVSKTARDLDIEKWI